uniref:Uncharacterized protein n=1 Tax=Rhizophagus irregularis (strain DAOM 181602 / DAOM 197198 / MUCL 43194) TaxID=747089 RepID=U9SYZ4_RHIID
METLISVIQFFRTSETIRIVNLRHITLTRTRIKRSSFTPLSLQPAYLFYLLENNYTSKAEHQDHQRIFT